MLDWIQSCVWARGKGRRSRNGSGRPQGYLDSSKYCNTTGSLWHLNTPAYCRNKTVLLKGLRWINTLLSVNTDSCSERARMLQFSKRLHKAILLVLNRCISAYTSYPNSCGFIAGMCPVSGVSVLESQLCDFNSRAESVCILCMVFETLANKKECHVQP